MRCSAPSARSWPTATCRTRWRWHGGSDAAALAGAALELAASHGRVHVVSPEVAATHTGHGNVMPQSLHGGPGRAGGGEELGGLKALNFYHRRAALQAGSAVLGALG
jgi:3,4-dehydroadipyl-CoA semialdehyde dehydrogenase